jgi:monovalent cation/hydrogen antiporter
MERLGPIELVMLLLVVATALAYVARRIRVAYPILLLLGGLALGGLGYLLAPDLLAQVQLEPDLVFLLFLPPILFASGFSTPIRDLKANARPIGLLAIGLVLFTTVVVGVVVSWLVPELRGAPAFTLGAIVAPPDAVAATAVMRRLGVPPRVLTILEGESLFNDASALIAYRAAVVATTFATFSILEAGVSFVVIGLGGIAVGVVVGWLVTSAWRRTGDATLEIVLSLLAPLTAYLSAELFGVSGVLATVTAGLIAGRKAARVLSPNGRLMGQGVWAVLTFLINSFVFMLIGLQLPTVLQGLSAWTAADLILLGAAVSLIVIVARIVWVFPGTYVPRRLSAKIREREPRPTPRYVFVVAWAGMRGAVSLAAALALPLDFPQRDLITYLAICVIVATLVGQGLTLPWIIRRLGIVAGSGIDREEVMARQAAVSAALERLDGLADEFADHLELVEQLRARFAHEADHALPGPDDEPDAAEQEQLDHQAIRMAVVSAQREAIIQLRDDGVIGDEALRRVERDLDLEAVRTGV